MIDDRRKPSAPPPPRDESVEILATDNTISSARRRASRKLRVPNDHVPRRSEEPAPPTHEPEAPTAEFTSDTDVSFSQREPGPVTEETAARLTDPSEPPRDFTAEAVAAGPTASAATGQPQGALGSGRRVPRPSMPSTPPPAPAPAAPSLESVQEQPAPAESRPAPTYSDPPPRVIDEQGVVRQVRRKIRSVGTGSVPPPPKRLEMVTESERPSAPAHLDGAHGDRRPSGLFDESGRR